MQYLRYFCDTFNFKYYVHFEISQVHMHCQKSSARAIAMKRKTIIIACCVISPHMLSTRLYLLQLCPLFTCAQVRDAFAGEGQGHPEGALELLPVRQADWTFLGFSDSVTG